MRLIVAATIMGAVPGFVNATPPVLTEKKPSQKTSESRAITLKDFVARMLRTAKDDRLAPYQAQYHRLTPMAPIKIYRWTSTGAEWSNRWCDLVLSTDAESPTPQCLVLIKKQSHGSTVRVLSYRLSLEGKLESVYQMTGKSDANGAPIRGSAIDTKLDASKTDLQKEASEELKFWLSQPEDAK